MWERVTATPQHSAYILRSDTNAAFNCGERIILWCSDTTAVRVKLHCEIVGVLSPVSLGVGVLPRRLQFPG